MSLQKVVLASENKVLIQNYNTGVSSGSMTLYYYISAIKTIHQSDIILVAQDTIISVYDASSSSSLTSVLYSYELPSGINSIDYNYVKAEILVSGYKFAAKLAVTGSIKCHPNCISGTCTGPLSPSTCGGCQSPSTATTISSISVCLKTANPPDAITNFEEITWSNPTGTIKDQEESLFDEIMRKYKNVVYIVVGLAAFCCLSCLCKSFCCGSSEEEDEPEQQLSEKRKYQQRLNEMSMQSNKIHPSEMY